MFLRADYWRRVIAGGTFGLYMTELLYLLNPQIAVEPVRFVRDIAIYFAICGVLFGNLFWLIHRLRERFIWPSDESDRTHGFGYFVAVSFFSALIYWAHLSLLNIYLPRGAVRILSKGAVLLGALAIVLLVMWMLERNATRITSRVIYAGALVLVMVYAVVTYQRREGYRDERQVRGAPRIAPRAPLERVTLVVLRDVPFDWIVQIGGEGALEVLTSSSESSYLTRVELFRTSSKSALWASLATGKLPSRHGVTGRYSFRTALTRPTDRWLLVPSGVGFRVWGLIPPLERISAQLPSGEATPLWALFSRAGASVQVLNWPASRGAEMERLQVEAPMLTATRETTALASILERDLSLLREATSRATATDVVIVVLDGIAEIVRRSPVPGNELPSADERAGALIREHLREIDTALRNLSRERLTLVTSNGGPQPPALPNSLNNIFRMAGEQDDIGAADGFIFARSLGIRKRDNPPAVQLIDLVPTVMYAAGYPIARDFDGRIAIEWFSDDYLRSRPLGIVQSYELSAPSPLPNSPPLVSGRNGFSER